jgi:O-antigen/teichoic acid export membrane protein
VSAKRQFGLGIGLRVFALVASTGIALRLTPFVVHTLGDDTYGLWTLVTTVGAYYGLLDLGLSGAITRHMAGALGQQKQREVNQIASTSLAMYLALGSLVFIGSIVCASLGSVLFHLPAQLALFRRLVLISGAGTGLTVPVRVFFGLLNAHLRFDLSAGLEIFTVLMRACLIYGFLRGGAGITALAWINLFVAGTCLFTCFCLARRVSPRLELGLMHCARGIAKKLIQYGSISLVAQLADLLRFQVDALVVAGFLGVAAVTHYNVAGSLAQYFISLMLAATGALGPVFSRLEARRDSERMRQAFHLGTKISVALATFVCFGLLAWGKPFILCWMGTPYLDAYPPLVALALGVTFALWQTSSLQLLYGISKHGLFAVFNSVEGLANLLVSLLLVRHFGLLGVALGTMIPMMITKLFVQPWYVCRAANFNLAEYYSVLGKALMATLVALLLPASLTIRFAAPTLGALFGLAVASFCCFVPVVYFLLFDQSEREIVVSIFPIRRAGALALDLGELK